MSSARVRVAVYFRNRVMVIVRASARIGIGLELGIVLGLELWFA
jgi:hypothetical protein